MWRKAATAALLEHFKVEILYNINVALTFKQNKMQQNYPQNHALLPPDSRQGQQLPNMRQRMSIAFSLLRRHCVFYFLLLLVYSLPASFLADINFSLESSMLQSFFDLALLIAFMLFSPLFFVLLHAFMLNDTASETGPSRLTAFKNYAPRAPRFFFIFAAWGILLGCAALVLLLPGFLLLVSFDVPIILLFASCLMALLQAIFFYLAQNPDCSLQEAIGQPVRLLLDNVRLWAGYIVLALFLNGAIATLWQLLTPSGFIVDTTPQIQYSSINILRYLLNLPVVIYLLFYAALCYRCSLPKKQSTPGNRKITY